MQRISTKEGISPFEPIPDNKIIMKHYDREKYLFMLSAISMHGS